MSRTTAALVRGIVRTDDVNIPDLEPFIMVANELVTEICEPSGYDDTRLELIERWLAAHFYSIRDKVTAHEQIGAVQESYQHKVGLNLYVTIYGQNAALLDTKGGLAALNKQTETGLGGTVSIGWLGSIDRSTSTEYIE